MPCRLEPGCANGMLGAVTRRHVNIRNAGDMSKTHNDGQYGFSVLLRSYPAPCSKAETVSSMG